MIALGRGGQPAATVELAELAAASHGEVVGLLRLAFAGQENARLGARYLAAWLASFEEDSVLLLARRGDVAVGLAVGTPEAREADRYRTLRGAVLAALARRPWCALSPALLAMAWRRLAGGAAAAVEGGGCCWYLALLATHPNARGTGIGGLLLDRFENAGRRRGWRRASLHVLRDRPAAHRFYERAGWVPVAPAWPGRLRYEKDLAAGAGRGAAPRGYLPRPGIAVERRCVL